MKNLLVAMMFFLAACGGKKLESSIKDSTSNELDVPPIPSTDLYSDGTGELIKTAELRIQVKDLKKSREQLEITIKRYSGFIEQSELKYEHPTTEEQLTIRVLSHSFEPLLKEIESLASYINYRKIKSDDVAKEFVDLESRLKTKREMEQRYMEILRSKAKTTDEVLKAEQQIGQLHEDIEAVVSRINFLRDQVRHSTIKLEMYQVVDERVSAINDEPTVKDKTIQALITGWTGLTGVLIGLLYLWPMLIIAITGWWIWRKRSKVVRV